MIQLSVIIPVYNAEDTIQKCLESIISQNFSNWECFCIDDGSTDKSEVLISEYSNKDCRIKLLKKKNGGVSSARNLGLKYAQGKWITFIDADDSISPGYFDVIKDCTEDLILVDYEDSEEKKSLGVRDCVYYGHAYRDFISKNLSKLPLRVPWAKFCRAEIIEDLLFDEEMRLGEDTLYFLQVYGRCKSICVTENCRYFYTSPSNTCSKYSLNYDEVISFVKKISDGISKLGIESKLFNKFVFFFAMNMISNNPFALFKLMISRPINNFRKKYLSYDEMIVKSELKLLIKSFGRYLTYSLFCKKKKNINP